VLCEEEKKELSASTVKIQRLEFLRRVQGCTSKNKVREACGAAATTNVCAEWMTEVSGERNADAAA
jgi:hypothetical protein